MTGSNMSNALANAVCQRCQARFPPAERIVNSNGELYHEHCFVCAQCFRPFPDGLFYELEGRKYCEHDFQMLFAPCCRTCGEFIIGRVIKAMNNNWHPGCFRCELCDVELADLGFVKNAGRHLCRPCHNREKAKGLGKYICQRCHLVIDEQPLMFKNDAYHPDHFSCTHCGKELTAEARELKGELYCLPCHDKMGVPICGACRRPIEGRVVNALGKQWHVEHFVCAKCEKPFLGHRHYEKKGLAYCETHYNQLFGDVCYTCSHVIEGDGKAPVPVPPSRPRPRSPTLSGLWVLQLRAQLALRVHSWASGWPGGAAKPPSDPHSGVGPQQGLVCALLLLFYLQQPAHPEVSRAGSQGSGAEEGRDLQGVPLLPPGAHQGLTLESACHGLFPSSDPP
ncbi:LIM and senescent cell antigen-like-containing domain protein 2 isoform X2 [Phocoena sinus]|uniref:LIM and senescent cell antigen-like-containing domain protein 2 isoform X2 n=1 Tax=Phocoena sinus TaxID=42100 RepID=UPI0013C4C660|nr:LIM and senescent cell antigen-like-containing domain protein 2 isoform X2 [Phocoena sinus]